MPGRRRPLDLAPNLSVSSLLLFRLGAKGPMALCRAAGRTECAVSSRFGWFGGEVGRRRRCWPWRTFAPVRPACSGLGAGGCTRSTWQIFATVEFAAPGRVAAKFHGVHGYTW